MLRLGSFLRRRPRVVRAEDKPAPASAVEQTSVQTAAPETPRAPTRSDQWRDCLERLLEEDGYVVQPSSEEMTTGSSVRCWGSDLAFQIELLVVSESFPETVDDAAELLSPEIVIESGLA